VVPRYRDRGWEVRVDLGDGPDRVVVYSTDPGFSVGERVRLENGRITRLYPRRAYSPA
jgi:outer membrane lipoprotein SlyB